MLRQIKQFKEQRKYSYENIRKALLYANYVQHVKFSPKYGLGLVPYVIDEAIRYHDDQVKKLKKWKVNKWSQQRQRFVKILTLMIEMKNEKKMIDLEDIKL